jgi:hypothetical protein
MFESKTPGPGAYQYADILRMRNSSKGGFLASKVRMKDDMYETESPGPGRYRLQSGFGMYSIDDDESDVMGPGVRK